MPSSRRASSPKRATAARGSGRGAQGERITVSVADAKTIESNVAAWQPQALVELPADADSS